MNTYAFLVKAKAKSDLKSLFCWFSAKSDSRAEREILNKLDDAEIEVGRGADYQLPVRTNLHVVDDLPAEGVLDNTWCDRYELGDDGLTWQKIATVSPVVIEEPAAPVETNAGAIDQKVDDAMQWPVAQMPMRSLLLSQFISEEFTHHATAEQRKQIAALEMDTDNSYVQNMLLAVENADGFKSLSTHDVWKYTQAVKTVFAQDKRHELGAVVTFTKAWVSTPHIDRGLLVKEWASGKRVTEINRTPSGANAGGGITADRKSPQTILNLEYEIALGLLARRRDFNIYNVPVDIEIQANGIMNKMDNPEWLATRELFVSTPGSLDYSRACIIATVKTTPENLWESPFRHREYLNKVMTESDHANPDPLIIEIACGTSSQPMPMQVKNDEDSEADSVVSDITNAYVDEQLAIDRGEFVPDISDPADPKWDHTTETTIHFEEAADDVQMETTVTVESKTDSEVSTSQSTDDTGAPAVTLTNAQILASAAPELAKAFSESADTEATDESAPEYPAYFEPGRYEGLPNNVYHAANGISSTQVKDARVSLMYFNARHVAKTIAREQSKVLDMGNLVHALALQPDNLEAEFSIEPVIPEGAFTTTATLRAFIDEYNAALPPQLSADDIKALLEAHNATLPAQVSLGGDKDAIGIAYLELPDEFKRIVGDDKSFTAAAMKACIKEYNATLPAQVKTSGSRDALIEQLAIINPDLVAQESQKPAPLKVSGTKAEMIQVVKSVKPDAVFADELLDAWRENPDDKILVTRAQLATATAIQSALLAHPTAGKFLTHPSRAVEVSYFGFDDETGLEIRVRPDLEIDMSGIRIGFDLKTISMFNVKQPALRAKLHREIIDRDYHLSAAMYMNTASLDQFFWIFVNKDEGYHWIAIVEASPELLELGALEYQTTMRAIANAFDTGEWPAPIVDDYADELNDFDMRRLEALRALANA
ncbi:RecE family exodeoxyribonuclease [Phytobacter palmae]|uniref:RecE family exodeoxyribonuclease n=1 Tax=Phytobacter palmae TaxID=1855371 RepID=A0ABU9VAB6_9ENTR